MLSILTTPVPNEVAAAFVSEKQPMKRATFDRLLPELKARAICVTGLEDLSAVQRVRDAIAEVPKGADWEAAKDKIVENLGSLVTSSDPAEMAAQIAAAEARAELLLRTHGFQAYAAANYKDLDEQRDVFPYWEYVTERDNSVRDSHAALNGLIIPCDSTFWTDHFPPWDWGCRCEVRPRTAAEADEIAAEGKRQINPEDPNGIVTTQRVADAHVVKMLEKGQLQEDGRTLDIRAPLSQGKPNAYTWKPGDLRLPLDKIMTRYDADTAKAFTSFAERTEVQPGVSLLDWLQGARLSVGAAPAGSIPFDDPVGFPQLEAFTKPGRATVARVESEIAGLAAEHSALISPRGEVLAREVGDFGSVKVPSGAATAYREGVVTHNHTNGTPPSNTDLATQFKLGVRELRAVTPDGGVFSVVLPEVPNARGRQVLYDNVQKAWARLVSPLLLRKASLSEIHAAIRQLAQENGLQYAYLKRETNNAK